MSHKIVLSIIIVLTSFYAVSASSTELSAMKTSSKILLGEKKQSETAYLMNDNECLKLHDPGDFFDSDVDWREAENGVLISNTSEYYDVNPISPWEYQSRLGKGMDVDWSKTEKGKENYNLKAVQDFESAGINHVRIRIKNKADNDLFMTLDKQIDDCINNGIIPIIAYQADEFKSNPDEENLQEVVDWWRSVAERYRDKS